MTDAGLYGDRLAKLFPMISEPSSGLVKSLQKGTFAAARMAYSGPVGDPTLPSPPDEAFALCLRLQYQRAESWLDGRYAPKGALKDETSIYDLRCETIVHFRDPFDFLYLYLPHGTLNDLANQLELGRVEYDVAAGANFLDPVMAHLGRCLLPMLERPHEANELFVGHVAMALNTHFLNKYAVGRPRVRSYRSGLAPWQLRTAKALDSRESPWRNPAGTDRRRMWRVSRPLRPRFPGQHRNSAAPMVDESAHRAKQGPAGGLAAVALGDCDQMRLRGSEPFHQSVLSGNGRHARTLAIGSQRLRSMRRRFAGGR